MKKVKTSTKHSQNKLHTVSDTTKKDVIRLAMLTKPIFPLLCKTAIPTIIGMIVVVMYNLTDTVFIGMLHNKSMTASIGVVFSFVSIMQAIGFWFGYGSGNRMSIKLGEKQYTEALSISSLGIICALASSFFITIVSLIFVKQLAYGIGGYASKELLFYTVKYLRIIIISTPFILYSITVYNQLRLCGNVKNAMLALLFGMLSNMILDPICIFLFRFGFIGAAYATLAGQIIGAIAITFFAKKDGRIQLKLHRTDYSKKRLYHILAGGAPNFSRQSITSFAMVLLNIIAGQYGDSVIAAITISSRIIALPTLIAIGWAQGFQPICAMNYGAKQYDRVKKAFRLTTTVGTIFLTASAIILFIFPSTFANLITHDTTIQKIACTILRLQSVTLPFFAFIATSSMLMQNTAKYFKALAVSILRQGLIYIPALLILSAIFAQYGIYITQPIADVLSFIITIIVVYKSSLNF